jgi:hypothetical protein
MRKLFWYALLVSGAYAADPITAPAPAPAPTPIPVSAADNRALEDKQRDMNLLQQQAYTISMQMRALHSEIEGIRLSSCLTAGVRAAECGQLAQQGQAQDGTGGAFYVQRVPPPPAPPVSASDTKKKE